MKKLVIKRDEERNLFFLKFGAYSQFTKALQSNYLHKKILYDHKERHWVIKSRGLTKLARISYKYFDAVDVSNLPKGLQERFLKMKPNVNRMVMEQTCEITPYTVLHLLPSAPQILVESAYKILARNSHPDQNPDLDGSEFRELNEAYERIKKTWMN